MKDIINSKIYDIMIIEGVRINGDRAGQKKVGNVDADTGSRTDRTASQPRG